MRNKGNQHILMTNIILIHGHVYVTIKFIL